jgi:hypothetical protein
MARSGGSWRMLPKDFPPWQTVYWWFRRFVRLLLLRTIHDVALMIDRERSARERGFDANKKVVGRRRPAGPRRGPPPPEGRQGRARFPPGAAQGLDGEERHRLQEPQASHR